MNFNETVEGIKKLHIQGATAIAKKGIMAFAKYVNDGKDLQKDIEYAKKELFSARPTEPMLVNGINYMINNSLSGTLIYNRKLSASEISQVNAWINEQKSIKKAKQIRNYPLDTDKLTDDADILHAYNFKKYGDKFYDLVNGKDLSLIEGQAEKVPTIVGEMVSGTGGINGTVSDSASSEMTFEFYGSFDATGYAGVNVGSATDNAFFMRRFGATDQFQIALVTSGANYIHLLTTTKPSLYVNKPVLMHGMCKDDDVKFYINGEEMAGTVTTVGTPNAAGITQTTLSVGADLASTAGEAQHNGWLATFDTFKSAEWVKNRALKFQKVCFFDDCSDYNISTSNQGVGMLENSQWEVATGTWKISEDTVLGKKQRVIKNSTDGVVSIPSKDISGTWEFDFQKETASYGPYIQMIGNLKGIPSLTGQNCLVFRSDINNRIYLVTYINGSASSDWYTAADYIAVDVWYKIRITRTVSGIHTSYIKGGIYTDWTKIVVENGANPVTNTSLTTSSYFNNYFEGGNKITNIKHINQVVDPT